MEELSSNMDQFFPFLDLPQEVREVVYLKLNQRTALDFRFVSRQCRTDIDALYAFHILLDDREPDNLYRMLDLRVQSCHVLHLSRPIRGSPSDPIFKHVNLVQHLDLSSLKVHHDFYKILTECSEGLQSLKLNMTMWLLNHKLTPVQPTLNFKNLRDLEVIVDMEHIRPEPGKCPNRILARDVSTFNHLVKDSLKPNLRTFKATLGYDQDLSLRAKQFSAAFLSFICHHSTSLQSVEFELKGWRMSQQSGLLNVPDDLDKGTLDVFRSIKNLRNISLFTSVQGMSLGLWEDFLQNQSKLASLKLNLTVFGWDLVRQVAVSNSETLQSIDISLKSLTAIRGPEYLDMSIFKDCSRLKRLKVLRYKAKCDPEKYYVSNFLDLPKSIVHLSVRRFRILTMDFLDLCANQDFCNLEEVFLSGSGDSGKFGVNGSVLEGLLTLPKMNRVSVMQLNFSEPEEREKILATPKRHGNKCDNGAILNRFAEICLNKSEGKWFVVVSSALTQGYGV